MALTTDVLEGPFTVVARRLLETSEMVRLAETNSALRQLWRELLEEKKSGGNRRSRPRVAPRKGSRRNLCLEGHEFQEELFDGR